MSDSKATNAQSMLDVVQIVQAAAETKTAKSGAMDAVAMLFCAAMMSMLMRGKDPADLDRAAGELCPPAAGFAKVTFMTAMRDKTDPDQ